MTAEETCTRCGRRLYQQDLYRQPQGHLCPAYVYVVHDSYGCETGCCGHRIYLCDEQGNEIDTKFEFIHPYGDDDEIRGWAESYAREHNVPVHWDECEIHDC